MGWGSGGRLFSNIISAVMPEVPDESRRKAIYLRLIPVFEQDDWDTQDECLGQDPAYDAALRELHPDRRY